MYRRGAIICLACLLYGATGYGATTLPEVTALIFSQGGEKMHYSISWSGGVKIGDLYLRVQPVPGTSDFTIHAKVDDFGVLQMIYPVDDVFTTLVRGGENKLPYRYEVRQKEGWGRKTHRLTVYEQERGRVIYRRNREPEQVFQVAGPVQNEFSSFFFTRGLDFAASGEIIVPTFADKKNNPVKVLVRPPEEITTRFGRRKTIPVLPIMRFKGLYDKAGDTVIWFGDDPCRIPYRISSEILIGSLVAELVEYENGACPEQTPNP